MAEYREANKVTSEASASQDTVATTVLRVKRKRDEDPFNALLVHHSLSKKKRHDADNNHNENSLFRFAGTIDETQIKSTADVVRNFKTKHHPHCPNIKSKNRKNTKENHQLARYRVISQLRQQESEVEETAQTKEDEEVERIFKVYDVIADGTKPETYNSKSDEDALYCNSVKMIREKLTISEAPLSKDTEYVYDLYFAPGVIVPNDDDMLDIEEFVDEIVYENEVENSEDIYDDEDDENDADNWRNDYPDEDEYASSEDDGEQRRREFGDYSSDEEDYVYNRYRTGKARLEFDPYAEYDVDEYFATIDDEDDET
ncbi:probable RNA polymerase II nuclear localization protein SLC7A6OS isoform X2 [Hydractinia symbiolongicarpus]|uniref:probable RNA polymerase II nuclear localization protein SLC7A6OS isoform X2 n=1 Tax=Hydractinia symbiolongicarpus TaxID=13093 RepID=UPI00254ACC69|nr:probable RNA polymerase II nuclear localization protein SLC7A6OS isoform X2 [Hydractinia symbiolongicarpus]